MPWAIVIIGIFLAVGAIYGVPTIVTGTSATDNIIRQATPFVASAVVLALAVIAIFGRRH